MKYLKTFKQHSDYQTYIDGLNAELPNVSLCKKEYDVHYNPIPDPYNGHDYVDFGLPSGTKWATMNVGANSITDGGLYFQWGDLLGYTSDQVGSGEGKKAFDWPDYKFQTDYYLTKYCNIAEYGYNGFTDNLITLEIQDDGIRANWGGDWHIPNEQQCTELLNTQYVTNEWVVDYQGSGINGRLFTSVQNNSKKMFIPTVGFLYDTAFISNERYGTIWMNKIREQQPSRSLGLAFNKNDCAIVDEDRVAGCNLRGVVG